MAEVEIKKHTKPKTVNFYHIEGKENIIQKIDDKLKETYLYLQSKQSEKIQTVAIRDNDYYICAMNKAYVDETDNQKFAWLISISRLDPTSPIKIGDLDKNIEERNHELDIKDNQGRVIDTQFLYDVNTHICAFSRTSGGLNQALFKSFLLRFCKVRGITFAVILEEDAIEKLDKLKLMSSFSFKIAQVNNFSEIENTDRDELKDIKYASDIGATSVTTVLQSKNNSKMDVRSMVNKAKFLFTNSEKLGIEKLNIDGIDNDGVFEPLDLIQHKLVYHGQIEFDNLITEKNMFDFLELAYHQNYTLCSKYK
ncbi:hypothetical protein PT287_08335 [Lactobacillus sp. ESL0679]|uniref:hypothetical protein n=1 Tax=Lactobacillus sp. ESL0679 TaxID=2983209 RepID=UPI0023F7AF4A|nr:hypothetical protein [Lactobacillus sp. ESL0679]MDF7683505.1 hypothetical protein [Lactobacillus sp. ESL0679]